MPTALQAVEATDSWPRTERTLVLGLIFEQRFIVMAECWAWEGGETENDTHTLEYVCMCVKCVWW